MAVPTPPRIGDVSDIETMQSAIRTLQVYLNQVYNGVRPAVLRTERMAEVDEVATPSFAEILPPVQNATTVSNPPTQAEVNAIKASLNAAITVMSLMLARQNFIEGVVSDLVIAVNAILEAARAQISAN
jgi:hypothetical protein